MNRVVSSVIGLMLMLGIAGCGSSEASKAATMKISGKLLVDDKPFGPATLTLSSPVTDATKPSTTGNVAKDGTISFVTYGEPGIAAGTYNILIAGDIIASSSVPACEPATIEVKSGATSVEIKLKSTSGRTVQGGPSKLFDL